MREAPLSMDRKIGNSQRTETMLTEATTRRSRMRKSTSNGYACLSMIFVVLASSSKPTVTTFCEAFSSTNRIFPSRQQLYRNQVDWNGAQVGFSHRRTGFTTPQYAESTNIRDERYATSDWLHNIKSMRKSTILREIKGPVSNIFVWALIVSVLHRTLKTSFPAAAKFMCIPTFPHSMVVSALGLLLVFRTNSAYQRFNEGRKIWEQILSTSRNLSRLSNLYEEDMGTDRRLRISRLLGAFPYLLGDHIQVEPLEVARRQKRKSGAPNLWRRRVQESYDNNFDDIEDDLEVIDANKIPWSLFPPKARAKLISSDNRPMWVCDRLSQEIMKIKYSDNFTSRERSTFLSHIDKLSKAVGECERITQTAVPQNYARHALRSLTIWLGTLPFALINEVGLLTAPVAGVTAWLLFGTYQIGAFIQDPFQGSLKVQTLCDAIYSDVMYCDNLKNPRESAYITSTSTLVPNPHESPDQRVDGVELGESSRIENRP